MLCVITVKIVNKLINTGTMLKSILIDTMQNTIEYINITHVTNGAQFGLKLIHRSQVYHLCKELNTATLHYD